MHTISDGKIWYAFGTAMCAKFRPWAEHRSWYSPKCPGAETSKQYVQNSCPISSILLSEWHVLHMCTTSQTQQQPGAPKKRIFDALIKAFSESIELTSGDQTWPVSSVSNPKTPCCPFEKKRVGTCPVLRMLNVITIRTFTNPVKLFCEAHHQLHHAAWAARRACHMVWTDELMQDLHNTRHDRLRHAPNAG